MYWKQLCNYVQRAWSYHCWQHVWIWTLLLSRKLHLFDERFATWTRELHWKQNLTNTSASRFWSVQLHVSKHGQLHLDHSRESKRSSRLVYKHSMVPTKRLLYHPRASLGFEKFCVNPPLDVNQLAKISVVCRSCSLLLLIHCCHDPFHRSLCNRLDVHDHWQLYLFLVRYSNTTQTSLQPSRPLFLHRSKPLRVHTKSVCVRTKSADFAPDPSSACYQYLGSMACRISILRFEPYCNTDATIGFVLRIVATFVRFFSFFALTSSSRTCSGTQNVSRISVFPLLHCF